MKSKYFHDEKFHSAKDAYEFMQSKTASFENKLNKVAHNFVTRFLKEKLIKTLKSNKTSATRLEISSLIEKCIKSLDIIMDSLEKELNMDLLKENIKIINDLMDGINASLDILTTFYKEYFYRKPKFTGKNKSRRIDDIFERNIRKELTRNI
jgi:hypothetical protein